MRMLIFSNGPPQGHMLAINKHHTDSANWWITKELNPMPEHISHIGVAVAAYICKVSQLSSSCIKTPGPQVNEHPGSRKPELFANPQCDALGPNVHTQLLCV